MFFYKMETMEEFFATKSEASDAKITKLVKFKFFF